MFTERLILFSTKSLIPEGDFFKLTRLFIPKTLQEYFKEIVYFWNYFLRIRPAISEHFLGLRCSQTFLKVSAPQNIFEITALQTFLSPINSNVFGSRASRSIFPRKMFRSFLSSKSSRGHFYVQKNPGLKFKILARRLRRFNSFFSTKN
jgi:hypothetical protein